MKFTLLTIAALAITVIVAAPANAGTVSEICGTAAGTRFNLEPRVNASHQRAPSIDFLRNGVSSGVDLVVGSVTGMKGGQYDVNRDADCSVEFEGTLPPLPDVFDPSFEMFASGDSVVRADSARGTVFIAAPYGVYSMALFRSTATRLLDSVACPGGRHNRAQTKSCWPANILVSPGLVASAKSGLAVDERPAGPGAGNIYIVFNQFGEAGIQLVLVSCKNDLSACSAPVVLRDEGFGTLRFSHVSVRPDGRPSLTWTTEDFSNRTTKKIEYASCSAVAAPTPPVCTVPRIVHTETQPVHGAVALALAVETDPKHEHRIDSNGVETYVIWEHCKVPIPSPPSVGCPDTDLVMKASRDDGVTWSRMVCVDCSYQHQHLGGIRTDRSRNIVNVAYYSSKQDTVFQNRLQVTLAQIDRGTGTPDPVVAALQVTEMLTDPRADATCPSCSPSPVMGVMARGSGAMGESRAYVHFTFNNIQGIYNGIKMPDANNHLGRVDY